MPLLNIFKPDVEKLAAQGDMQSLRKLLSHGDSTIRLKAAWALADLGPAGIDILIAALNSNNRREIETAKDGLVSAGAAAVEPLIKTGENLIDSYEISNTLEKIGKPAIEPMIKTALENSKASYIVYGPLAKIGGERGLEVLCSLLNTENSIRRGFILDALNSSQDPKAKECLQKAASNDDDDHNRLMVNMRLAGQSGFYPIQQPGKCDMCGTPFAPLNAFIVPNSVFYTSAKYKQWLQDKTGMPAGEIIGQMQQKDLSSTSAVCPNCLHLFLS